jgi:hypothetical protein
MRRLLPLGLVVVLLTACGGRSATPHDDPGAFAIKVVNLIVTNQYSRVWTDLHPDDQRVAPLQEYVACETRSPVLTQPTSVKVAGVSDESVGLGNGTFVPSKAVRIRMVFPGQAHVLVHTVHVVASKGRWKWILPSWRFRDYQADRCPTDAGSAPPPASA